MDDTCYQSGDSSTTSKLTCINPNCQKPPFELPPRPSFCAACTCKPSEGCCSNLVAILVPVLFVLMLILFVVGFMLVRYKIRTNSTWLQLLVHFWELFINFMARCCCCRKSKGDPVPTSDPDDKIANRGQDEGAVSDVNSSANEMKPTTGEASCSRHIDGGDDGKKNDVEMGKVDEETDLRQHHPFSPDASTVNDDASKDEVETGVVPENKDLHSSSACG